MKRKCKNCKWCAVKGPQYECRAEAPRIVTWKKRVGHYVNVAAWPEVKADDWCKSFVAKKDEDTK